MLIIQRALPLKDRPALVKEVSEETELETVRRAEGGIMSFRAETRSKSDSPSTSTSESLEISDSIETGCVNCFVF